MKLVLLLALAWLAVVPLAESDTIYTYTGDTFRRVSGVYGLEDRLSGFFVVNDAVTPPPGPQGAIFTPYLLSWSFTDGHQTLTESNSTATFVWGDTSDLGPGVVWNASIQTVSGDGFWSHRHSDRIDLARLGLDRASNVANVGPPDGSQPGTWAVQTVVPEPSTLLLVGLGLAGVAALRRRRP
jgi:PEP-CTERM motif